MVAFDTDKQTSPASSPQARDESESVSAEPSASNNPNSVSLADFRDLSLPGNFRQSILPGTTTTYDSGYVERDGSSMGVGLEIPALGVDVKAGTQGLSVKGIGASEGVRLENNELLNVRRFGKTELKFGPQSANFKHQISNSENSSVSGRIHQDLTGDGTTTNLQFDSPSFSVGGIVSHDNGNTGYGVSARKDILDSKVSIEGSYAENIDECEKEKTLGVRYRSTNGFSLAAKALDCDGINGAEVSFQNSNVDMNILGTENGFRKARVKVGSNVASVTHTEGEVETFIGREIPAIVGRKSLIPALISLFTARISFGVTHTESENAGSSTSVGFNVKSNLSAASDARRK